MKCKSLETPEENWTQAARKELKTLRWTEGGRLGVAQRAAVGAELRTLRFGSAVWPLSRPSSGVWAVYLAPPWLLCLTITISATTVFLSSRTTSPLLLPCYPRRMGLSQLLHSACLSLPFIHSFLLGSLNLEGSKGGMRKPSQSFKIDWSIFIIYHICLHISLSMLIQKVSPFLIFCYLAFALIALHQLPM